MTSLTDYFLVIPSPYAIFVKIMDNTSYFGYQVYVNNSFVGQFTSQPFTFPAQRNQKIDILGISSPESGFDFSATLDDSHGDKLAIEIPNAFDGTINIYSDAGKGIIDYGRLLASMSSTPENVGWSDESFGAFSWGEDDEYQTTTVIFTTARQKNGTIKFAVVPVETSIAGLAVQLSATFVTTPDEIRIEERNYDPVNDSLVLEILTT